MLILINIKWVKLKCNTDAIACIDHHQHFCLSKQTRFCPYMYITTIQRFPQRYECVCVSNQERKEKISCIWRCSLWFLILRVLRTPLSLWIAHTLLFRQIPCLISASRDILLVSYSSGTGKDFLFYTVLSKSFTLMSCIVLGIILSVSAHLVC